MSAKLLFDNLTCVIDGHEKNTPDHVIIHFTADNGIVSTWPRNGEPISMERAQQVSVNIELNFEQQLVVELYNLHNPGPFKKDYYEPFGSYTFNADPDPGNISGIVTLSNEEQEDVYELEFQYAQQEMKYIQLLGVYCLKASSAIDSNLISALSNAFSGALTAFGDAIAQSPDPRLAVGGAALSAAGGLFKSIPEIAQAISESSNSNDQLYLSLGGITSKSNRIYPTNPLQKSIEMNKDSIEDLIYAKLIFPIVGNTTISLWDNDLVSDHDWMGSFTVNNTNNNGFFFQTVVAPATEGSIYLISYNISNDPNPLQ